MKPYFDAKLAAHIHTISDETHHHIEAVLTEHQKQLAKAMQEQIDSGKKEGLLMPQYRNDCGKTIWLSRSPDLAHQRRASETPAAAAHTATATLLISRRGNILEWCSRDDDIICIKTSG
jgi:hypothetical protein